VDTRFVATAAANPALQPNGSPINDTFSISANIQFANINPDEAQTLAVLPCRRFTFLPESTVSLSKRHCRHASIGKPKTPPSRRKTATLK